MFFEVLLYLLAAALILLVPVELTSARRDHVRAQSYYFSNGMAQMVMAWLCYSEDTSGNPLQGLSSESTGDARWPARFRLKSPEVPGLMPQFLTPAGGLEADWKADLFLYADAPTLAGGAPHVFKLRVIASLDGYPTTAHEFVLQQQTFAQYGFFVDNLPNNGYYTAMVDDVYEGEFHVNGKLPLMVDSKLFSAFVAPVFRGKLSFTQADGANPYDGIFYQSGSSKPFDAAGKTITDSDGRDRYSKLLTLGRAGIKLERDVAMPMTNTASELPLAKAAWFGRLSPSESLSSVTIPNGVSLSRTGDGSPAGVYIRANLREMTLDVQDSNGLSVARNSDGLIASGNPVMRLQEESNAQAGQSLYTKVVELRDPSTSFTIPANSKVVMGLGSPYVTSGPLTLPSNKTVVVRDPCTTGNPGPQVMYEVVDGLPNGVVFVDGNIGKVPALDTERTGGSQVNRDALHSDSTSVGGLKGINYGAPRTIAVNLAANNYIRLAGNLTRGDARPGEATKGRRDGLGIVGYDVVVAGEIPRSGDTAPFYLYSLLFAGRRDVSGVTQAGSVIYENWDNRSGWGRLFSYGSYVVGQDRIWGDNGSHGWMPTFRHDSQLAASPPPFYPTRSDYKLQSYQEIHL
jgi:hypothetical protein